MKIQGNKYKEILKALEKNESLLYRLTMPKADNGETKEISEEILFDNELSDKEKEIFDSGKPFFDVENYVFNEPFIKPERLIILGAGHISVRLSSLAKMCGFRVVVADDRKEFADSERFPEADSVICGEFADAINELHITSRDYIVIVTRGHMQDRECIVSLSKGEEPYYIGLMGSRRRVSMLFSSLEENGIKKSFLDKICTPIGLDIGSKTIEEIGISIMAELIEKRRKGLPEGESMKGDRSDHDFISFSELAKINEPCILVTLLKAEGSTPRSAGASMEVFKDGKIIGSIGGGCVEGSVIERAEKLIGTGKYKIIHVNFDDDIAMKDGMICGGRVTLLLQDIAY